MYAGKVNGFVLPIRNSVKNLLGHVSATSETDESEDAPKKTGLLGRLQNLKRSLKEMSDMQKLILLTIAVCLPAGILISTVLVGFIRKRKK